MIALLVLVFIVGFGAGLIAAGWLMMADSLPDDGFDALDVDGRSSW